MGTNAVLDYFYGKEADQFSFFTVPKILFTDDKYKGLPCEAKMLYGMMLDRMSLSIENQWFDEQKRAFIKISTEYITENLGCGRNKALSFMKLLEEYGLIERVKHGQGKASTIYVKKFIRQEIHEQIEEDDAEKSQNQTSEKKIAVSEVSNLNIKKFKNQTSRSLESKHQEVYFQDPNNTNINNTEINHTESNHIVSGTGEHDTMGYECDEDVQIQAYSTLIKNNVAYRDLVLVHPEDKQLIDGIMDLILETVLCDSEKILVASNWYSAELVKSKLLKLNYSHMEYVLHCFKQNTTKVKNIRKYMLAVLFNAPTTIDSYYMAEVNNGFADSVC